MSPGYHRWQRIVSVAGGLLLTVGVLLAHRYLPPQASELAIESIQSLHGPGFGIVALLILFFVPEKDHPGERYFKAAALAMILAGLSEAAQIPGPRDAQISDLVTDAIGILGFLGISALFNHRIRQVMDRYQIILLVLVSAPAAVATLTPTLWSTGALIQRQRALPQILGFDSVWEHAYSSSRHGKVEVIPAPSGWPTDSRNIGRLLSRGRWGIMLYIYPHADWSNYSALSFVAASRGGRSQELSIGIRDIRPGKGAPEARYMTGITVGPVPTRYRIFFDDIAKEVTVREFVAKEVTVREFDTASGKEVTVREFDTASGKEVTVREFDTARVHDLVISEAHARKGVEVLVDDFRLE